MQGTTHAYRHLHHIYVCMYALKHVRSLTACIVAFIAVVCSCLQLLLLFMHTNVGRVALLSFIFVAVSLLFTLVLAFSRFGHYHDASRPSCMQQRVHCFSWHTCRRYALLFAYSFHLYSLLLLLSFSCTESFRLCTLFPCLSLLIFMYVCAFAFFRSKNGAKCPSELLTKHFFIFSHFHIFFVCIYAFYCICVCLN